MNQRSSGGNISLYTADFLLVYGTMPWVTLPLACHSLTNPPEIQHWIVNGKCNDFYLGNFGAMLGGFQNCWSSRQGRSRQWEKIIIDMSKFPFQMVIFTFRWTRRLESLKYGYTDTLMVQLRWELLLSLIVFDLSSANTGFYFHFRSYCQSKSMHTL